MADRAARSPAAAAAPPLARRVERRGGDGWLEVEEEGACVYLQGENGNGGKYQEKKKRGVAMEVNIIRKTARGQCAAAGGPGWGEWWVGPTV